MGPLPLRQDIEITPESSAVQSTMPTVLQDGSYATQSYVASSESVELSVLPLRHLLLQPSFFVCSVLSNTLAKLCINLEFAKVDASKLKDVKIQCLLVMTELLVEYESTMDELDKERIEFFVNCMLDPSMGTMLHDQILTMSHDGREFD